MHQTQRGPLESDRRLDSWKEIAAFFDRDERTVRRWEKERALPVYRLPGKGRGSVYAFAGELTQWLKSPNYVEDASPEVVAALDLPASILKPADSAATQWDGAERRQKTLVIEPAGRVNSQFTVLKYALAVALLAAAVLVFAAFRFPSLKIFSALPSPLSHWFGARGKNSAGGPGAPARGSTSSGKTGPANPEALDLYLKGRYEWSKRSPESLNKAVDYFTQSIVRDPNYAPAYAGLADTYNLLREYTSMPSSEAYPRAIAAAKKAVELDDTLSDAHRSLAFATFYWNWDFRGGEREFKRAIELDPHDAVAHHWYGTALEALGRFPESLAELERARQLDPASASIVADTGLILFDSGKPDESAALLSQIESADPTFLSPHSYLARIALARGNYPAYLTESKRAAELRHDTVGMEIAGAAKRGYDSSGEKGLLESIYRVQKKYYDQKLLPGITLAETCAKLGRENEVLGYLRQDFERHDPAILGLLVDPFFTALRGDPAFRQLVVQIGLPQS
jgi:tetratricopeptide (TPR) repeat protein